MFKPLLLAGLVAAAVTPSLASAQVGCPAATANRAAGTVVGAGVGAILGSVISGGRAGGAIVGGLGGAVAGNAIAGAGATCANQYGYYDANGAWVPNTATAWGYYGPDGRWVDNAPPPAPMAYQPAYAPGPGRNVDAAYTGRDPWAGAPGGVRQREDWLEDRIRAAMNQSRIERYQGVSLLQDLHEIRNADQGDRAASGQLDPDQRRQLMSRLDRLNDRLSGAIWHDVPDPR